MRGIQSKDNVQQSIQRVSATANGRALLGAPPHPWKHDGDLDSSGVADASFILFVRMKLLCGDDIHIGQSRSKELAKIQWAFLADANLESVASGPLVILGCSQVHAMVKLNAP